MNKVHPDWIPFFDENKKDLDEILSKINYDSETIFPKKKYIFRALFYNSPQDIKLVLLGQDPYINSEIIDNKIIPQACGLSFSVPKTHKKIPPSLQNIFKEIKNCYPEYIIPQNGSLTRWAKKENILLLNSALTVIEGKSNTHALIWADFTNKLIKFVSDNNDKTVFLLMGSFAINKSSLIDTNKHKIFTCIHPSPLSAYRGFFGSNIFKKINDHLTENNIEIINW
jgi:uracil-DNA glycosylase